MIVVFVGKRPIIISKLDGKFYAVAAICTHMYGYLPSGAVKDGIITCPVHGAQFDLRTGKVVKDVPGMMKMASGGRGAHDLIAYEVEVNSEEIMVDA
jgi:nitrite reductase/ring-hydroxylating ferredoxin subunit